MVLVVAATLSCASHAVAQTDLSVERRLLEELVVDGKYAQVVTETRQVEKLLFDGRPPKGGQQTVVMMELLGFRMFAERKMGRLADAEKSLGEAQRLFKSKDFQRALPGFPVIPVSLLYFSLIDEEAALLLERVRSDNQAFAVAGTAAGADAGGQRPAADAPPDLEAWGERFERIDKCVRLATDVRKAMRLPAIDDSAEARSPHARAMLGPFRPHLLIGRRYLEASKLPFTQPGDRLRPPQGDESPPQGEPAAGTAPAAETAASRAVAAARQRRRAIEYLEQAVADADAACDAALKAFVGDDDAARRAEHMLATKEAARIRCLAREALAEAALRDGDADRARQILSPALADLRKAEKPRHPALAEPLILDAEISLAEMRLSIGARNAAAAERQSRAAVDALREAKSLLIVAESGFDPAAPVHDLLANVLAQAESQQKATQQLVAEKDAADAAARRALKAINASESRKPAPKPAPSPVAAPKAGP